MNRTGRWRVGVGLAAIFGLAACGGSDDDVTAVSGASVPSSDVAESTADDDGAQSADSVDPGDDSEPDAASGQSGGGGDWCDEVRAAAESDAPSPIDFDFFGLDPAGIEAQVNSNVEVLRGWASSAPSEIEDSVDTIVEAFQTFAELGGEAGWDLTAMVNDPQFVAAFEDPELTAATDAVDAYNRDVCGVDLTPDGGTAPPADVPAASGDDLVAQFLAEFGLPPSFVSDQQRECMNTELQDDFPDGLGDDFVLDDSVTSAFDLAAQACGVT